MTGNAFGEFDTTRNRSNQLIENTGRAKFTNHNAAFKKRKPISGHERSKESNGSGYFAPFSLVLLQPAKKAGCEG